jgi:endonuclease/exonuclease/phosphatase family metal-dependent hydrolase
MTHSFTRSMALLTLLLCPKVEAQKNEPPATFNIMTFNSFRKIEKGKRRIDWVLTQGPVKVNRTEIVLFDKSKQLPSDHQPVTAMLWLE